MLCNKNRKPLSPLWRAFILLAITLLSELFLSNFYALYDGLFYADHRYSRADMTTSENQENVWEDGTFLVDDDHVTLRFFSLPSAVHSVSLTVQYAEGADPSTVPYAELGGTDENLSEHYVLYQRQALTPGIGQPYRNRIRFSTHGTPSVLELYFDSEAELLIRDICFNEPEGFSFSFFRWGLLIAVAALLWLGKVLALSRRRMNFSSREGKAVLAALVLFAMLASLAVGLFLLGNRPFGVISYPLAAPEEYYNPYIQQFDAFQKGQLHLDVKVSEKLAAMENPYDPSLRAEVDALWDRAYFEGRYYSYFGIAPILTLYYPFYLLGGVLPGDGIVLTVFSALASVFTVLCLWELCKLTKKKISVTHFVWGSVACLFASMFWLTQRGVDRFYYVAVLSAAAFGALTLYCLLKGLFHPQTIKRRLFLAGAGASYSLLLLSRINAALLTTLILFCLLIVFFRKNRKNLRSVLADLACPVVLVLATVAFLLAFNAARFHNPLEFGARYQLTVSNVSFHKAGIENLLPALYHYFFEPLAVSTQFPFVSFSSRLMPNYGHYVYVANTNAGLLCLPLTWALFAFGALWKKCSLPKAYRRICLAVLVALPLGAFVSFSLGGSIVRYVADLAPLAAMLATLILWELCDGASLACPCHSERFSLSLSKIAFVSTAVIGCFLLCIHDCPDLAPYSSRVYGALQGLFAL